MDCPYCQSELTTPLSDYVLEEQGKTFLIMVYRCFCCGVNFTRRIQFTNEAEIKLYKQTYKGEL